MLIAAKIAGLVAVVCQVLVFGQGPSRSGPLSDSSRDPVVYYVPAQELAHGRHFSVEGRIPQLQHAGSSEEAINANVRSVVEHAIERAERTVSPTSGPFVGGGDFTVNPVASLIFASSKLLSLMIPVTEARPHGTIAPYWVSLTVDAMHPETNLSITMLVTPHGLHLLSAALRGALSANRCVAQLGSSSLVSATAPNPASFAQFALLPTGLVVGFPATPGGQLSDCGNFRALIPYSKVDPGLTSLGRMLVCAVVAKYASRPCMN